MKKAVFWDFDGTLAYSKSLWSGAMMEAVAEFDAKTTITLHDIRALTHKMYPWENAEQDNTIHVKEAFWPYMEKAFCKRFVALGMGEEDGMAISKSIRNKILDVKRYTLYDDALEALIRLKEEGIPQYILSNNYPELEEILEQLGILYYFDGCVISAVIGYDKPRGEFYDYAVSLTEGIPRHNIYHIGDNQVADYNGAKEAGLHPFLVHRKDVEGSFDSLLEVVDMIIKK